MRIARFAVGNEVSYGVVDPSGTTVTAIEGHPIGDVRLTDTVRSISDVRLLAPILPSKIVAVGKNYTDHAAEMGSAVPPEPLIFLKPSTAIVGPDDAIVHPPMSSELSYEAELAVVIGRICKDLPLERVPDVILGYTCANDVTARDLQRTDGQWTRSKGFDTFCPLGPWIETDLDASDLPLRCRVNGDVRQDSRTSLLVNGIPKLITWISRVMTLLPGDVILTGTPAGVGRLRVGDRVEVEIEGIGTLANPVIAND